MKRTLALAIGLLSLSLAAGSVAFEKKHEKALAAEAQPLGFTKTKSRFLDSVYLKPGVNFSEYAQLDFAPLDTSNIYIREPSAPNDFDEPWVLTDKDKAYLQQKYLETFTKELIDSKRFSASGGSGKTLRIKTTLQEIAPSAPKDDLKSRPNIGNFYTEGAGTMTMKMEIYDTQTNALVGLIADEADVGNQWERNDRSNNRRQLGLSFTRWADSLGVALGKK
ncbi:MAG TPA: DUF3313 family protein [Cellvibrio sp.]|nr:DUF3313 family protein [Cellvibrio sp.]